VPSGIARGLYTPHDLARVHALLHAELDGLPLAYLHCPHHPEATGPYGGGCACRKPRNGLLHQARELLGVPFAGGYLLGDSARDLLMARDLPLTTIHLHCGKSPIEERRLLDEAGVVPHHVAADLPAAAAWILAREAQRA
jgi:D-glycero-D-manno-heptose 1,7-bisphosphate phosphatase